MFNLFGKSNSPVEVSPAGSMHVSGWDALLENALTKGDAYVWTAQDTDIVAADTMLSVRNDSHTQKLVIVRIEVTNGDVATRYEIHKITASYTPTGTDADEINLGGTGKVAPVSAIADETGQATQGTVFAEIGAGVAVETYKRDTCLVLNHHEAVAVDQVTESDAGACSIYGFFIDRN